MQTYEHVCFLGQGAYGNVALCRIRGGLREQYVALKTLRAAHLDSKVMRMTLREIGVLRLLGGAHPNIVKLLQAFKAPSGRVSLVFEYYGKSAATLLSDRYPFGVPHPHLKRLAYQLLQALRYLHSRRVLHRDIKPANILVDADGVCRLCDFGFARLEWDPTNARAGDRLTPYVVTRWYRAPEVLLGMSYGAPADVWSLGCTLAELATGEPLLPGESSLDQLARIVRTMGPLPPRMAACLNPHLRDAPVLTTAATAAAAAAATAGSDVTSHTSCPPVLRQRLGAALGGPLLELLAACLRTDPRDRPTADQLLAMPYFSDVSAVLLGTPLEHLYDPSAPWMPAPSQTPLEGAAVAAAPATVRRQHADDRGSSGSGNHGANLQAALGCSAAQRRAVTRAAQPQRATADEADLPVVQLTHSVSVSSSGLSTSPQQWLHRLGPGVGPDGVAVDPLALALTGDLSDSPTGAGLRALHVLDFESSSRSHGHGHGHRHGRGVRARGRVHALGGRGASGAHISLCAPSDLRRHGVVNAAAAAATAVGMDSWSGLEDLPSLLLSGPRTHRRHSSAPHMRHMPVRPQTEPAMLPAPAVLAPGASGGGGRRARLPPRARCAREHVVAIASPSLSPSPDVRRERVACYRFVDTSSTAGDGARCAFPRAGGGSPRGIAWPPTVGATVGCAAGAAGVTMGTPMGSDMGMRVLGSDSRHSVGSWLGAPHPLQATSPSLSLRAAVLGADTGGAKGGGTNGGDGSASGGGGGGAGGGEQAEAAAGLARPLAKVHMRTSLESYIRQLHEQQQHLQRQQQAQHQHPSAARTLQAVPEQGPGPQPGAPSGSAQGDWPQAQAVPQARAASALRCSSTRTFALLAQGMAASAAAAAARMMAEPAAQPCAGCDRREPPRVRTASPERPAALLPFGVLLAGSASGSGCDSGTEDKAPYQLLEGAAQHQEEQEERGQRRQGHETQDPEGTGLWPVQPWQPVKPPSHTSQHDDDAFNGGHEGGAVGSRSSGQDSRLRCTLAPGSEREQPLPVSVSRLTHSSSGPRPAVVLGSMGGQSDTGGSGSAVDPRIVAGDGSGSAHGPRVFGGSGSATKMPVGVPAETEASRPFPASDPLPLHFPAPPRRQQPAPDSLQPLQPDERSRYAPVSVQPQPYPPGDTPVQGPEHREGQEHGALAAEGCEAQAGWQPQASAPSVTASVPCTGSMWSRGWSAGDSSSSVSGSRLVSRAQAYGPTSAALLEGSSHRGSHSGSQHDPNSAFILGPSFWRFSNTTRLPSGYAAPLRTGGRPSLPGSGHWEAATSNPGAGGGGSGGPLFYAGCPMPTAVPPLFDGAGGNEEFGTGAVGSRPRTIMPRPTGLGTEKPVALSWAARGMLRPDPDDYSRRGSTGDLGGPMARISGFSSVTGPAREAGGDDRSSGPDTERELAAARALSSGSGNNGSVARRYQYFGRSSSGSSDGLNGGGDAAAGSLGNGGAGGGAFLPLHRLVRSGSGGGAVLGGPTWRRRRASMGPYGGAARPEATALGPVAEEPGSRRRKRSSAAAASESADRPSDSTDAASGSRSSGAAASSRSSGGSSMERYTSPAGEERARLQTAHAQRLGQGTLPGPAEYESGHGNAESIRGGRSRARGGWALRRLVGAETECGVQGAGKGGDTSGALMRPGACGLSSWIGSLGRCFGR